VDTKSYSRYFKAFSDPTRLKILQLLSSKEMTVTEIVKAVNLSQPTISRHLAIMRDAGILSDRRDGQNIFYKLNKNVVIKCCSGFCDGLRVKVKIEKKKK